MTIRLSDVKTEFGGTGNIPSDMRSYLKYGATTGWYGGVAEHDNNSAIPSSGNLRLTNFASPADKDFVSDTYSFSTTSYIDYGFEPPYVQSFVGYCLNNTVMADSGLYNLTAVGTAGSRTVVGKSTYGLSGQTATVVMIGDYVNGSFGEFGFIIGFAGDQRASGWGGAGSIQAPYSVTVNGYTFYMSASSDPNGFYFGGSAATYWTWASSSASLTNANYTFRVAIY